MKTKQKKKTGWNKSHIRKMNTRCTYGNSEENGGFQESGMHHRKEGQAR
jgi:hypothetical protein